MQEEIQEHKKIKEYLLGIDISEEARESVEERLMRDTNYFEEIQALEEELIQDYVDGKLAANEITAFKQRVLLSPDNRDRVKFARAFRKYVDEHELVAAETETAKRSFFAGWLAFPAFRVPVAAGGLLMVVIASFFAWNYYTQYSDKQTLALFKKAYKDERTLQSRITELDYAPFIETRSGVAPKSEKGEITQAKIAIQRRAEENPNAANLHLQARVLLAEKDFDGAEQLLERAQKLDPNNAQIFNDLGVAAFEKALPQTDSVARSEQLRRANENFESALKIDPNLLEARFNKARCLEALNMIQEAIEAWNEYRKYDETSGWAREAGRRLRDLQTR